MRSASTDVGTLLPTSLVTGTMHPILPEKAQNTVAVDLPWSAPIRGRKVRRSLFTESDVWTPPTRPWRSWPSWRGGGGGATSLFLLRPSSSSRKALQPSREQRLRRSLEELPPVRRSLLLSNQITALKSSTALRRRVRRSSHRRETEGPFGSRARSATGNTWLSSSWQRRQCRHAHKQHRWTSRLRLLLGLQLARKPFFWLSEAWLWIRSTRPTHILAESALVSTSSSGRRCAYACSALGERPAVTPRRIGKHSLDMQWSIVGEALVAQSAEWELIEHISSIRPVD